MAQNKIIVEDKSFSKIFSEKDTILTVPLFQRSYCWTDVQIKELFLDIKSNEKKFLGAVIFQKSESDESDDTFEVIDGQQRISTLFWIECIVCFKAWETSKEIREFLEDDEEKNKTELNKLARKLDRFIQEVLVGLFTRTDKVNYSKLECSLNDMGQFNAAIRKYVQPVAKSIDEDAQPKPKSLGPIGEDRGNLTSALALIEEEINSHILNSCPEPTEEEREESGSDEEVIYYNSMLDVYQEILDQVKSNLEFAVIKLSEGHDADEVFSKLNTSGVSLNAQDIIKNQLFKILPQDKQYHFWTDVWREFEEELIEAVDLSTDEEKNAREIDKYLRSFWHPYSLTLDPNTGSSENQVLETVQSSWQEIIENSSLSGVKKAEKILDNIRKYVPIYNCIKKGIISEDLTKKDKTFNKKVANLSIYEPNKGSYPYLFDLLLFASNTTKKAEIEQVTTCLKYIESYHVRRNLFKDDSSVKNVFSNLWKNSNKRPNTKSLNRKLHDSNRPWYENDQIMLKSQDRNFYDMGQMAKFILLTYEEKNSKKGDDFVNKELEKEHLLPRTITKRNSTTELLDDWDDFTLATHESVVNLWGNILPVSSKFNKTVSNKGFKEKKNEFMNHTYRSKTADNLFKNYDRWGEAEIRQRNKELYDWALSDKGWPKPLPVTQPPSDPLLVEVKKQKTFFDQQNIREVYFYPHSKVEGQKRRIGAVLEFEEYMRDKGFYDFSTLSNGSNEIKDAYFFSNSKDPIKISIQVMRDRNGSPKFWLQHPLKANFCGGLISDDSVIAFVVHKDKKLYVVDTSIKIIKDKAVKFFNT